MNCSRDERSRRTGGGGGGVDGKASDTSPLSALSRTRARSTVLPSAPLPSPPPLLSNLPALPLSLSLSAAMLSEGTYIGIREAPASRVCAVGVTGVGGGSSQAAAAVPISTARGGEEPGRGGRQPASARPTRETETPRFFLPWVCVHCARVPRYLATPAPPLLFFPREHLKRVGR